MSFLTPASDWRGGQYRAAGLIDADQIAVASMIAAQEVVGP
jgi:hypothetical protein